MHIVWDIGVFLPVGGDGTSCEVVNGLFPQPLYRRTSRRSLSSLPGTGNNFLRDFADKVLDYAVTSLVDGRSRLCDVMRLTHKEGIIHYINLLSIGFPADVTNLANRRLKALGQLGYWLGFLLCLVRLEQRAFPIRVEEQQRIDRHPCLMLTFNNSDFTRAKMMLAPHANVTDGLVEIVRIGPMGRIELIANLPSLRNGSHITHPLISRCASRRVEFYLDEPINTR